MRGLRAERGVGVGNVGNVGGAGGAGGAGKIVLAHSCSYTQGTLDKGEIMLG
jgi:hypothetical protein